MALNTGLLEARFGFFSSILSTIQEYDSQNEDRSLYKKMFTV